MKEPTVGELRALEAFEEAGRAEVLEQEKAAEALREQEKETRYAIFQAAWASWWDGVRWQVPEVLRPFAELPDLNKNPLEREPSAWNNYGIRFQLPNHDEFYGRFTLERLGWKLMDWEVPDLELSMAPDEETGLYYIASSVVHAARFHFPHLAAALLYAREGQGKRRQELEAEIERRNLAGPTFQKRPLTSAINLSEQEAEFVLSLRALHVSQHVYESNA